MDEHEQDGGVAVGPQRSTTDRRGVSGRRVIRRTSPGWLWLLGVVAVSLALWAGLIWLGMRVFSWLT